MRYKIPMTKRQITATYKKIEILRKRRDKYECAMTKASMRMTLCQNMIDFLNNNLYNAGM